MTMINNKLFRPLFSLILVLFFGPSGANAYDFSATSPDGNVLFYNIISGTDFTVGVVSPRYSYYVSGSVVVPDAIYYDGQTYTVTKLLNPSHYGAFQGTGITSITLPETINEVQGAAFYGCSSLQTIISLSTTPPSIEGYDTFATFMGIDPDCFLVVPDGTGEMYFETWGAYFSGIIPANITSSVIPSGSGTVNSSGSYGFGRVCTLTATANAQWHFLNWTKEGEVVSTEPSYSFTVLEDNAEYVANFVPIVSPWTANPYSYSETIGLTTVIAIKGDEQYSDWLEVGVFCGEECRGTQLASEFPITHRYLAPITVFGEIGDVLTFKLYDHSIGQELDLESPPAIIFDNNGLGNPIEPFVLDFTTRPVIQESYLAKGWNWWAPNVITNVDALQTALGDNLLQIESQYDSINNNVIKPGEMYKIHTSTDCEFIISGEPAEGVITINPGLNWFGFTGIEQTAIEDVVVWEPLEGDKIISQNDGFAIYDGSVWEGTLSYLYPSHGYVYLSLEVCPPAHTLVDYIWSELVPRTNISNSTVIETDVNLNNISKVRCKMKPMAETGSIWLGNFMDDSHDFRLFATSLYSDCAYVYFDFQNGRDNSYNSNFRYDTEIDLTIEITSSYTYVYLTEGGSTSNYMYRVNNYGTYLDDANYWAVINYIKLGILQIWDANGVLVKDLNAALDSEGTPCMYDEVNKEFIYKSGVDRTMYYE